MMLAYLIWFIVTMPVYLYIWLGIFMRQEKIGAREEEVLVPFFLLMFVPLGREIVMLLYISLGTVSMIGDMIAYFLIKIGGEEKDDS